MRKFIAGISALAVSLTAMLPTMASAYTDPFGFETDDDIVNNSKVIVYNINNDKNLTPTFQSATVKNGRLKISGAVKVDGVDYDDVKGAVISKSVSIPTIGITKIAIGGQTSASDPRMSFQLTSGSSRVAWCVFDGSEQASHISTPTASGWTNDQAGLMIEGGYNALLQGGDYAEGWLELNYNTGRATLTTKKGTRYNYTNKYYMLKDDGSFVEAWKDDAGRFYSDKNKTQLLSGATEENTKLGVPFDTTKPIDKITLMGNRRDGYLWDRPTPAFVSYDYLRITNDSVSEPILADEFNDSTMLMDDYGWVYELNDNRARKNYYYNTDTGYGLFFKAGGAVNGSRQYGDGKLGFISGDVYNSGMVSLEFTTVVAEENGDNEVLWTPTVARTARQDVDFLSIYGSGSGSKTEMAAFNVAEDGSIVFGKAADGTNEIIPKVYNPAENTKLERDFKFIFDLDNGKVKAYYEDENGEMKGGETMSLTADANGDYVIDEFAFGVDANQTTADRRIEYNNIKLYTQPSFNVTSIKMNGTSEITQSVPVRTDAEVVITLTDEVKESSLSGMKTYFGTEEVMSEVMADPSDSSKVIIKYPFGLKYNASYTIKATDDVMSNNVMALTPHEVTFSTEKLPITLTDTENDGTNITITINNQSGTTPQYTAIVAAYNVQGRLVDIIQQPITLAEGEHEYPVSLTGVNSSAVSYKTMIWKSFSDLTSIN